MGEKLRRWRSPRPRACETVDLRRLGADQTCLELGSNVLGPSRKFSASAVYLGFVAKQSSRQSLKTG